MSGQSTIFVVDDDPAVSRALRNVADLVDLPVAEFTSAEEYLTSYDPSQPGCLVLDIKMPGMTGLELQKQLASEELSPPVIIISGHADVRIAVEALLEGAVTLLEKPFRVSELAANIRRAIQLDTENRAAHAQQTANKSQLARLTEKEREVLDLVTEGNTNKQIASRLHLSIRGVEDRRARLMKKLGVRSMTELLQLRLVSG